MVAQIVLSRIDIDRKAEWSIHGIVRSKDDGTFAATTIAFEAHGIRLTRRDVAPATLGGVGDALLAALIQPDPIGVVYDTVGLHVVRHDRVLTDLDLERQTWHEVLANVTQGLGDDQEPQFRRQPYARCLAGQVDRHQPFFHLCVCVCAPAYQHKVPTRESVPQNEPDVA